MSRHDSGHEGGMGNKGIVISGGTVNDSALVAGENNRVTIRQQHGETSAQALAQARADAARLLGLLASGGYDLPDAPTAHAAALGLKDELDEEEPDQSRLRKWLTRLRGLVAGVAPLAELVVAVEESVRMLAGG